MTFFKVWKICDSSERSASSAIRFEREYSCNEGNLNWKIINREVSEPSGLVGLFSYTVAPPTGQGEAWRN